jgi:hypothetical protein
MRKSGSDEKKDEKMALLKVDIYTATLHLQTHNTVF